MSLKQAETHAATAAPKVTMEDIEGSIKSVTFINAYEAVRLMVSQDNELRKPGQPVMFAPWELQVLTLCLMVMKNGFTIVGKNACVSPENYDRALGEKIAREDAVKQIWPLMGYALRDKPSLDRAVEDIFNIDRHAREKAEESRRGNAATESIFSGRPAYRADRVYREAEPAAQGAVLGGEKPMDLTASMEVPADKPFPGPVDSELEQAFRVIEDRLRRARR